MRVLADVKRIAVVVGTRPEAVKLAPVIHALHRSRSLRPIVVSTAQHAHMTEEILQSFGIEVNHNLRVMKKGQSLSELSSRLAARLGRFFHSTPVNAALVQGDTTSTLLGGLCAFYHHIPVGHVEAGLRTGDTRSPFPEETNRRLVADLATWHFAPTRQTAQRLRRENIPPNKIFITGNTVIDALRWMAKRCDQSFLKTLLGDNYGKRIVLVTCHRRENLPHLSDIATALASIASTHPECVLLFPVHPNPVIRAAVGPILSRLPNVRLCEPLSYEKFLGCLKSASLVLSDSGGVQEEATALGRPVLVLRDHTERQEGIAAGALKLVGTSPKRIVSEAHRFLDAHSRHHASRITHHASQVFGDGRAASRIVKILERSFMDEALEHLTKLAAK
jgi:UDP-N-acetylglucosamine 2-epimerase (non-hydrolysing)